MKSEPTQRESDAVRQPMGRALVAIALALAGLILILAVPTAGEGPLLLYINEQHAIRLVDALGLSLAVPSWLYLNLVVVRLWRRRRQRGGEKDGDREDEV